MRAIWLTVTLCGCNQIFGIHGALSLDAPAPPPDAVGCSGSVFAGPFSVPVTTASTVGDPFETASGLELWFDHGTTTGGAHSQIFSTTRSTVMGTFVPEIAAAFDDDSFADYGPKLTGDGLDLIYVSNRGPGGYRAWEVTRSSSDVPFPGTSAERDSLGSTVGSIAITVDGLDAYVESGGELYGAVRSRLDDTFGAAIDLGVAGHDPAISPDQLELYYDDGTDILRRRRASIDAPFGAAEPVLTAAVEPAITADSRTLVVVKDGVIQQMTRSCP